MVTELAPTAFADFGAEVVALEIERTFWEKAAILHAEFHRPADKKIQDRYARHYADFAALWQHPSTQDARHRIDLLDWVRHHKARFFSSAWANYATAIPGTLRLVPPARRLTELLADYESMRQMFLNNHSRSMKSSLRCARRKRCSMRLEFRLEGCLGFASAPLLKPLPSPTP